MEEIWKDIIDYEGYYMVSNLGRIKRLTTTVNSCLKHNKTITRKEHIMSPTIVNRYLSVKLTKNSHTKSYRVHRLVAQSFIPNPCNLPQINHKDENKINNCVDNLEWCSAIYNQNYGTRKYKRLHSKTKEIMQIDKNENLVKTYFSLSEASRQTGISIKAISRCATGKSKTSGGFIWKYVGNVKILDNNE